MLFEIHNERGMSLRDSFDHLWNFHILAHIIFFLYSFDLFAFKMLNLNCFHQYTLFTHTKRIHSFTRNSPVYRFCDALQSVYHFVLLSFFSLLHFDIDSTIKQY